jgi:DNA-binding IclR family transcriptional regulator
VTLVLFAPALRHLRVAGACLAVRRRRASTSRVMSVSLSAGSRLPAYCTSLGRVLLAHNAGTDASGIPACAARGAQELSMLLP